MRSSPWILVLVVAAGASLACSESDARRGSGGAGAAAVAGAATLGGTTSGGSAGAGPAGGGAQGGASGAATGGSAGASGGAGGSGGTSTAGAGNAGSGGMGELVSNVNIAVHPDVNTILVVTWEQLVPADTTWLEFTFEDGNVMTSRPKAATAGAHKDVVLGVPGETEVTVRIVNAAGAATLKSADYRATTGPVPSGMPRPQVLAYEPSLASPEQWMFGAVEDSQRTGSSNRPGYYQYTFWTYIMDRKGRIVWYYSDAASAAISSFQRVARDGEYIWLEKTEHHVEGDETVIKMTLDREYYEEVSLEFTDCIDVTDDGSLLFDQENPGILKELTRDGQIREIFDCSTHFADGFDCYTNTVNWNPADDTVVLSYPRETTVIQVSRQTGEVVGQYGTAPGSYAFEPSTWSFEFQHFANISKDGTLMVSTHLPGNDDTQDAVANQHAFAEFTIDRNARRLVEKWVYTEGPEWAMYKGMAIRLANGNTLGNYGTGGTIREITPDKQTAFQVKFDVSGGDDFFNKMVGHNVLVADLYALNGGGPR